MAEKKKQQSLPRVFLLHLLLRGVRKAFIRDEDGDGVLPVRLAANRIKETDQYRIIENRRMVGMKYDVPSMERLNKAEITEEMRRILGLYIRLDRMSGEIRTAFLDITAALSSNGVPI